MSEQPVVSERLAYRVKEAAALVGLSETMMRELLLRGEIRQQESGQGPPGAPLGAGGMAGAERTRRRPRRLAFPGSINRIHHR